MTDPVCGEISGCGPAVALAIRVQPDILMASQPEGCSLQMMGHTQQSATQQIITTS
jgi:hypothetical protein